ncbi:hypothetical protein [Natronosalvus rutilus]|uniref:Uncharacterized protein n=1 Tax=Natronosalvus rutilus TaxID=2953753 RepID=A0A9E7N8F6_9EURY|nr:hypothetical protein [Natronosalvus rutilus]UTF52786.1 hypothetical protein NGM29_13465 [Natronosalvus rutilus]
MPEFDFLDASGQAFSDERNLFEYVDRNDVLEDVGRNVNIIGSVNNFNTRREFFAAIESNFERIWGEEEENLELLSANSDGRAIPYYVYYDDDFPLFITTANISEEMPDTIEKFIVSQPNIGRFWISMQEMDSMRARVVREDPDVIIPFFTGHRSKYSDVPAEKREDVTRTMTYWAIDGRKTYKEMRKKYGILPTNIRFERPDQYKFGLKQEGIITHQKGTITKAWDLFQSQKERQLILKRAINSGGAHSVESGVYPDHRISSTKPWEIDLTKPISGDPLEGFESRLSEDRWKFGLSEFSNPTNSRFSAEVIDEDKFGRTEIEGNWKSIRVYPIDGNDIDPQFRVFNFVQDHFDASCEPMEV